MIYLDDSENYKSKHQNKIESAYFGSKSFNLFTTCTYYQNSKLPITITTEESGKLRVTSLSCVNKVITYSLEKLNRQIKTVYIVSDGWASQFRSRYVFRLHTHIYPDIAIDWHYKEANQGKRPMDVIGGTVRNLVYCRVLSGDVVINTFREFREFENQISSIDCLFLDKSEFIQELDEEVSKATPIPSTLKVHKFSHVRNGPHSFSDHFFKLSEDLESFQIEKYGVQCRHKLKLINLYLYRYFYFC